MSQVERRCANGFSLLCLTCLAALGWELFWVPFPPSLDQDEIIFSWRSHTGRSNAGSTRLAYLVVNVSNLSCSASSVLVWTKWAEKSIWQILNTRKWLVGFFYLSFFSLSSFSIQTFPTALFLATYCCFMGFQNN